MRIPLTLLITLFLLSCGSTFVDYDYDKNADFSAFTTYQYDLSEPTGLSSFDEQRFIKFTDSVLQSRGFERTDYNDMFIKVSAQEYETQSRNTLGIGVGGGGGNVGVGVSGGIPVGGREMHQEIITTFYEATGAQKTIWEATSNSDLKVNVRPEKRDLHYKKLVEKILSKYPPKL